VKFLGYWTVNKFYRSHISPANKYRWLRWLGSVVRMREPPKIKPIWRTKGRLLVEKTCGNFHMEEKG
jgi:hypothetical protein